jgi:glycosyl hydrolase family 26
VLAGIGASVALALGCVGMFVLTPGHHTNTATGRTDSAALAGNQPPPTLPPTPQPSSSRKPSPSPSHKPRKHHAKPPSPSPPKLPHVTSGNVFVGVAVKSGIVSGVQSFHQATGAHISMVEIYASFGAPFPATGAHRIVSTGATPLVQWNPRVHLGNIVSGGFDTYLHNYAKAIKRFGHPITLSFGHEMNGPWSQWGAGHVSPATFVKAWRHIHNVFASQGVHNVTWSWDPSHTGDLPRPWWPGPRFVDKIGIDGYQRPGQTFADIFADRLANIRSFASEPIFIAETSVAPSADQARQVIGLFNGVVRYHLSGFIWFNINHLEDWRLEGRPAAIRAFRNAVAQTNNG